MHDLRFLRQNRERVEAGIALKGVTVDLQRFYAIEERRLAVLHERQLQVLDRQLRLPRRIDEADPVRKVVVAEEQHRARAVTPRPVEQRGAPERRCPSGAP